MHNPSVMWSQMAAYVKGINKSQKYKNYYIEVDTLSYAL